MQYGAIIMTKLNVLSDIELDSFHSPLIPLLCNHAVLSRDPMALHLVRHHTVL